MSASALKIRPLGDRIVIDPQETDTTSPGGIVIPDTAKEKPAKGIVVAIGPGKATDGKVKPLEVKVGDKVLYSKYAGTNINLDSKEYLVMREDDVMGVIE
ncbi:MAG TPA: co-chaperone GroES [Gammaproteobacteria bacterium]|jgi:chaperonin GroES|nr:co-chaperone GroES [Gammaproteobacteria bacterium]